ncbi:alpha/beta hydrolase [Tamlana fucoidanivorans]|uniref:Alpha/beta hydrolase n=1 Tax=Allotamlana fucoidanivorans TaxID=2583814 RepID=A0A5C4SQK5_9FLAO|nr:alpha/beta hydrolase [Tamlana fucoidanivorans]TNJ46216.1 alpha/beta hydrolase [Tamlana fucoidanivorans]
MRLFFLWFCFIGLNMGHAQVKTIEIWDSNIPNSQETEQEEVVEKTDITRITLVKTPTLQIFLPAKKSATGQGVIICPGGGYRSLSYDWEGTDVAKWFNSKGIAAFVLKSRLPLSKSLKVPHKAPLQDAQRAMRWVRYHAAEFNIKPDQIGIMGFSAGGHLAGTLSTQFNKQNEFEEQPLDTISARPDFSILIYPVVTLKHDYTHKGSRNNLLGKDADENLKHQYSNELHVTENSPPTFIVHSGDDKAVPVENSLQLYKVLNNHGVKAELHVYPFGGHGYGLAVGNAYLETWTDRLHVWLSNL